MKLVGVAACVPKTSLPAALAYEHFPREEVDRIVANIGAVRHREVDSPTVTSTDLGIEAAKGLLPKVGWTAKDLDLVVMVTHTPDHPMPSSSHRIHAELGMRSDAMAIDLVLACSGFTHGMVVIRALLANGTAKRALLVCGDVGTHRFRAGIREARHHADLANAILFGDAGGAAVFEAGTDQVRAQVVGADGSGYGNITIKGGGYKMPWSPALMDRDEQGRRPLELQLNGPEVFSFCIRRVPPMLGQLTDQSGWGKEGVDRFVFHQANRFMIDFMRKKLGLPGDKLPISIDEFGNTSSASIPVTLVTRCTDRADLPTKWIMMGFGTGLSWSGLALETEKVVIVPLIEV